MTESSIALNSESPIRLMFTCITVNDHPTHKVKKFNVCNFLLTYILCSFKFELRLHPFFGVTGSVLGSRYAMYA